MTSSKYWALRTAVVQLIQRYISKIHMELTHHLHSLFTDENSFTQLHRKLLSSLTRQPCAQRKRKKIVRKQLRVCTLRSNESDVHFLIFGFFTKLSIAEASFQFFSLRKRAWQHLHHILLNVKETTTCKKVNFKS